MNHISDVNVSNSIKIELFQRMTSSEDYAKRLEETGIHLNAKNFVVQQGKISQVATMKPKERADLFQKLSGLVINGLVKQLNRNA